MKIVVTVMLLMLFSISAEAQISFSRADIETQLSPAQVISYVDTTALGKIFDLRGPVFDLTGSQSRADTVQRQYIDPALTSFPHEFPNATHAQIIGSTEGDGVLYHRLDDNGLYYQGLAAVVQGADYILKYNPERPEVLFPFKNGSSWTYTSGIMTPFEGFTQVEEVRTDVVGEGTLRTPQGNFPCLVVKNWERSTTKIELGGQVLSEMYTTIIYYEFMTKTGVSANITIDTLDEGSSTPKLETASWSVAGTQTSVDPAPVAELLQIEHMFPNPVRDGQVAVQWSSIAAGSIQVAVTDVYGRIVRIVRQGAVAPGRYTDRVSVQDLPSGQYFFRMIQGSGVAIRPLTIVH